MLLVSTTRIIPGRAVPSFLSGRYPAVKVRKKLYVTRLYDLAARVTDALRANDIDSARTLMPDLRESHVAVLEALKNLEEWGLSTSMR